MQLVLHPGRATAVRCCTGHVSLFVCRSRCRAPCYQAQFTPAQYTYQKAERAHAQWTWVCFDDTKASTARHHRRHVDARHHGRTRAIWRLSRVGRAKKSLLLTYPTTKFLTTPVNMALGGIGISFRSTTHHFIVQKSQFISLGIPPIK